MLNETLEADRAYRKDKNEAYERGYAQGKADAEPHWIPVTERLPDRFGPVLVTVVPRAGELWTKMIVARYSDLMGIAKPCFWIGNVGKPDFENITKWVTAWMPKPEPYKGVTE